MLPDNSDLPITFEWACRTDGKLSQAQRDRIRVAIRRGYRDVVRGLAGWPFRRSQASGEFPRSPDSRLARVAEEAAGEQGLALLQHGYRTWLIGSALAGLRMWDLPRGYLRRAYRAYPASGAHREVPRLIRQEARDVPDGRFAMLRAAGMDRMVAASPTRMYGRYTA